jgi:hypothetical protein
MFFVQFTNELRTKTQRKRSGKGVNGTLPQVVAERSKFTGKP